MKRRKGFLYGFLGGCRTAVQKHVGVLPVVIVTVLSGHSLLGSLAGDPITEHDALSQQIPAKYYPVWLGINFAERSELYNRIDLRVDLMLQAGLMDEIETLLSRGIPKSATALQAIGYKEFICAMQGEMTMEQAAELVKQRSRNYAKRQLTWFRRRTEMHWLIRESGMDADAIFDSARREIPFFAQQ